MPRTRKPPGTAVDRRNGRRFELAGVPGERFDLPADLAAGLLAQTVDAWNGYWDDPVCSVHTAADRAVLLAWVEALDRHTRLSRAADAEPLVSTSQGTTRNPLYAVAEGVWKQVEALQAQLGIGPRNRVALGISVLTERRTLDDLNAKFTRRPADGPERADPRAQAREGVHSGH